MKKPRNLFFAVVAGCWISVFSAFAGAQSVNVVTSVIPVAYVVEELGGERVRVASLVPPGASPHTFEPVPSNVRKLARARYFVGIGGEFDAFLEKLLAAAPKGIEAVALSKAPNLNLLEGEEHHHHGEQRAAKKDHDHHGEEKTARKEDHHDHGERKVAKEGGEEHEEFDPHFWLDPVRVRDAVVPVVTQRLIAADPAGKDYYEKRRQDFRRRLTALDQEIRAELAKAKTRKYIAFHAAWAYFAGRYGLEKVAVVQEFAGEEPTPKEVAKLVSDARAEGVGAVLLEPQLNPRVARTIGEEFGARTVMTDPLGDPGDAARDTYEKLMRFNARAFGQALQRNLN